MVHLSHEHNNEHLLVDVSFEVNFFPAWQHRIPLVIYKQLNISILVFALSLVTISRSYS